MAELSSARGTARRQEIERQRRCCDQGTVCSTMRLRFERGPPDNVETLHPAYFALVMATGIVALATHLHGIYALPNILFWLNAFFFVALIMMTGVRIVLYPDAFAADLHSHRRGVGFFTVIAAFGVFGSQLVLQAEAAGLAIFFWIVAAALWLVVIYGMLAVLSVKQAKPSLADGINGGWLVIVVANQSVSILTVLILPSFVSADIQKPLMFTALILWLSGGALYLWADYTDLLSLHVPADVRRGVYVSLLDQHGLSGYLDPGWCHPAGAIRTFTCRRGAGALRERFDAVLLVRRELVDPPCLLFS